MLKKRIIGTVLVKDEIAVQSFSYSKWLPLGKPECLVKNLDRWGADEIVVISIDREEKGPNYKLLNKIVSQNLSTPLTYGGGIRNKEDAISTINRGAERILVDNLLFQDGNIIQNISETLGSQAIIGAIPLVYETNNSVLHLNYRTKEKQKLSPHIVKIIKEELLSELVLIDAFGEGGKDEFNNIFVERFKKLTSIPLMPFGGIVTTEKISQLLSNKQVSGVLIGNSLNYKENSIKKIKNKLKDKQIRIN